MGLTKICTLLISFAVLIDGQAIYPLDPLSSQEILLAAQIITQSQSTSTSWGFNYIQLQEPPKSVLLPYFLSNTLPAPGQIPRKAFSIVIEKTTGKSFEGIINLDTSIVESWKEIGGGMQPMCSGFESELANNVARADPQVIQRCNQLGYSDMDRVFMSDWTMGYVGDQPSYDGKRYVQMFLFGENFAGDNYYAHPFPFIVVVDLVNEKVVEILNFAMHNDFDTDNQDGVEIPRDVFQYDQDLLGNDFVRKDIKPMNIQFPQGPSYVIDGNQVKWQKFQFRVGFNGREGLVIHHVGYNDSGRVRPILYRAALSEMFVPYGDPRPPYHRKTEFDEGGYGMGIKSSELTEGSDCIGAVHFFSEQFPHGNGTVKDMPNRICIAEEDAGVLWKHTDEATSKSHTARSRRLAISFVSRVDNYDYGFYWYFYQDASIQMEIKLTGIMNTNMLAIGSNPTGYSVNLTPRLTAQFHQHFFAVRMDLDIEGPNNSVSMVELVALEETTGSAGNPYGQGIMARVTPLQTAAAARTKISPAGGRCWKFTNPNVLNPVSNEPVAWKLIPANLQSLLMKMDSPVRARANFSAFDVWVTQYDDNQMFAAGDYLGQTQPEGLPKWIDENPNATLVNQDIVLWHVFGVSHLPRLEDWPIMPSESCGFWLKPVGFFTQNPALDVPALKQTK